MVYIIYLIYDTINICEIYLSDDVAFGYGTGSYLLLGEQVRQVKGNVDSQLCLDALRLLLAITCAYHLVCVLPFTTRFLSYPSLPVFSYPFLPVFCPLFTHYTAP